MSKFGEPFGLSFENEEQALSPAASIVPPASPIGRPFGLTFGEAEPNGGVFDSTSGAPTPGTAEPTPPVLAEPPSSTSNSTLQPTAVPGERERRLARAEADYQRAVREAMVRLASYDGRAATIDAIASYRGWTREQAAEKLRRSYYDGNQRQKFMVDRDRTTASLVYGDEAAMNDTDAKLKNVGFLLERDPYGEPWKSVVNSVRGARAGSGDADAGVLKFQAGSEVNKEHRILADMTTVIEGVWRPDPNAARNVRELDGARPPWQKGTFRPDVDTDYRVLKFMRASPQMQAKMYEEQRLLVENINIAENPTYRRAKAIQASYKGPDPGFEPEFNWWRNTGRGLTQGITAATLFGIPVAGASEAGYQLGEAVEYGATPEQYLEVREGATTAALLTSLPLTKILGRVQGVQNVAARLETRIGPGGVRVMKIGADLGEAKGLGSIESELNDKTMKTVLDPQRDTSSGALQTAIRGSVDDAAAESRRQVYELTPVELDAARARATGVFAGNFADAVRAMQHGMQLSANAAALSQYVDISVSDRPISMPVAEIEKLQKAGKITPEIVVQWGVQDQIRTSKGKGDVTIPLRKFMKARLAPESIDGVARSVRFGKESYTAHEAAEFGKQREAALAELTARMKMAKPIPDEGAFAFADASNRLRQAGLSDEGAERGATLIVDAMIYKARHDKSNTAKLDADGLYYREVARADGAWTGILTDAKFRQDYEAFSKRRGQ